MEKQATHFDYLVIGAGSGGVGSGRWAAKNFGVKVGIIEHQRLGGTCVNVGCVPKKVMFNLATFMEESKYTMGSYGVNFTGLSLDWKVMKANRDAYIKRMNSVYEDMLKSNKMTYIKGFGAFVDNKTVECEGQLYTADHILIATGSTPEFQKLEGIEHTITSDGFFDLEEQPKRVVILGGGYIGVEIGQIFHALGTKVVHLVRSEILRFLDTDVRNNLLRNMGTHNYDIRHKQGIKRIEKLPSGELKVTIENYADGTESIEIADQVMVATGRKPNIEHLNLKATDIKLAKDGSIIADEFENTSVDKVYAVGDVTNKLQLTPVAIRAGRCLAERIFGGKTHLKADYENVPTVIFSHPPVGVIGLGEQEAVSKYGKDNIKVYRSEFNNMFFSLHEDKSKRELSLFKIICLKSDSERVIGVHANGRAVDEMMQGIGIAIKMGATKKDFDRCVAIHPTASEEFVICDPKYE